MYGLPSDFDGSKPAGRCLQQICFGISQVQLRFDQGLIIAVESKFLYKQATRSEAVRQIDIPGPPVEQCILLRLLHHAIVDASGTVDGTLTLRFDNGDILQCLDQPYYEAYQITQGDRQIVV